MGQKCISCDIMVYPHTQRPLRRPDSCEDLYMLLKTISMTSSYIYLTSLQATTETPFHLHVGERLGTCRGRITGWHIKLHIVATVVDLEIPQDYSNRLPCVLECFAHPSLVSWSNHIALKGGEGQKSLGRETSLLVWQHSNSNSSNCPSVCQYVCPPISSPSH